MLALLDGAWRAVPAGEELPIDDMWVGFRPGSRDEAPMLGPSGVEAGLVLGDRAITATASCLTPVTAESIARYML